MIDPFARSIFEQAVDNQWSAVAGIRYDERPHLFDSRFLKRGDQAFWFETLTWPQVLPTGKPSVLKATFEFGSSGRCVIVRADMRSVELMPNPCGGTLAIACCSEPSEIKVTQRRANFRTLVPSNAPLSVAVWKIPPHWVLRDRPKPSMQLKIELIDLSTGGMCLNVRPRPAGSDSIGKDDRVRVEMRFEESDAILDGQVVHRAPAAPDGSIRIGVAFRKLENTIEGRRGLFLIDRAIGALQRKTIRRAVTA
jgi:PilZ domain